MGFDIFLCLFSSSLPQSLPQSPHANYHSGEKDS